MYEKIVLVLDTAEKNYIYNKNLKPEDNSLKPADHIIALNALFESFIHYGLTVSQASDLICELDKDSYLYRSLVEPHLRVVDDIEMIAKQYAGMYIQYIAKVAQGFDSEKAIKDLFA